MTFTPRNLFALAFVLVIAAGSAAANAGEREEAAPGPRLASVPDTAGLADYLQTLGYELDTIFAADEGRFSVGALRPEPAPEPGDSVLISHLDPPPERDSVSVSIRITGRDGEGHYLKRRGAEYHLDGERKTGAEVLRLMSDNSRYKILRGRDGMFTVRDRLLLEREGESFREIGPRLTVGAIDPRKPKWVESGGEGRFEGYFEQSFSADLPEVLGRALAFGPDGTVGVVFRDYVSVCRPAKLEDVDEDGRRELVTYRNYSTHECGMQEAYSERLDQLFYLPLVHQWNGAAWVPAETRHPDFYRSVSERLRKAWKWAEDNCAENPVAPCSEVSADQLKQWTGLTTRWANYRPQDGK